MHLELWKEICNFIAQPNKEMFLYRCFIWCVQDLTRLNNYNHYMMFCIGGAESTETLTPHAGVVRFWLPPPHSWCIFSVYCQMPKWFFWFICVWGMRTEVGSRRFYYGIRFGCRELLILLADLLGRIDNLMVCGSM